MTKTLSLLACCFALSPLARAETIKLKIDVSYDRCDTVDGKKTCDVTAPFPQKTVEIEYDGKNMGTWKTEVTENGFTVQTSVDVTRMGSKYYFQASTVSYQGSNPKDFHLDVLGSVITLSPALLNEITFAGPKVEMGAISLAPKVGIASAAD